MKDWKKTNQPWKFLLLSGEEEHLFLIRWRLKMMVQIAVYTHVHIQPRLSPTPLPISLSFSCRTPKFEIKTNKTWKTQAVKLGAITASASISGSGSLNSTACEQLVSENDAKKKRVFFLDVNPLCYVGSTPSLRSFGHWVSLFFSQVSHSDPVIAVSSLCVSYSLLV